MNRYVVEQNRRYIRIKLASGKGEISILRMRSVPVHSKGKPVLLLDISPGGLSFKSDLAFPVSGNIVLSFKAQIINNVWVQLEGRIVWRRRSEQLYDYGMEFNIDERHRNLLIRLLNELLLQLMPKQQKIHTMYRTRR